MMVAVRGLASYLLPCLDEGPDWIGLEELSPRQEKLRDVSIANLTPTWLKGTVHRARGMG